MRKEDYAKELQDHFGYFDDSNEKLTISDYRELLKALEKLDIEASRHNFRKRNLKKEAK